MSPARADFPSSRPPEEHACGSTGLCADYHVKCKGKKPPKSPKDCSAYLSLYKPLRPPREVAVPMFMEVLAVSASEAVILRSFEWLGNYDKDHVALAIVLPDLRVRSYRLGELFSADQGRDTVSHHNWLSWHRVKGNTLLLVSGSRTHLLEIDLGDGALGKRTIQKDPEAP